MDFINDDRRSGSEISPGEFENTASRIAREIERRAEESGISPKDIPRILSHANGGIGDNVNCYPGEPTDTCYPVAFFISLTSHTYTKGCRGHLSFHQALATLIKHMQGVCAGHTRAAIVIADSWDRVAFDYWKANIENIIRNDLVEIYMIYGGRAIRML